MNSTVCTQHTRTFKLKIKVIFVFRNENEQMTWQNLMNETRHPFKKMKKKTRIENVFLPNKMPDWQINNVKISARVGSPRFEDTANGCNNGITSSLAIAWSNLGAPVKLWRPAPSVDKNEPIKMTHSFGHAIFATTNLPPIECPSLTQWMRENV